MRSVSFSFFFLSIQKLSQGVLLDNSYKKNSLIVLKSKDRWELCYLNLPEVISININQTGLIYVIHRF